MGCWERVLFWWQRGNSIWNRWISPLDGCSLETTRNFIGRQAALQVLLVPIFGKSKFAILAARHFEMRIACFATGRSLGIQKLKELLIRFSDTIEGCICGGSILVFAAIYWLTHVASTQIHHFLPNNSDPLVYKRSCRKDPSLQHMS